MPKKCPVCNSTRYEKIDGNFCCARCGFINKSKENPEKPKLENKNEPTKNRTWVSSV